MFGVDFLTNGLKKYWQDSFFLTQSRISILTKAESPFFLPFGNRSLQPITGENIYKIRLRPTKEWLYYTIFGLLLVVLPFFSLHVPLRTELPVVGCIALLPAGISFFFLLSFLVLTLLIYQGNQRFEYLRTTRHWNNTRHSRSIRLCKSGLLPSAALSILFAYIVVLLRDNPQNSYLFLDLQKLQAIKPGQYFYQSCYSSGVSVQEFLCLN
ncbi:MAG: hypothetical protein HQL67_06915 [Magnetococcales bacterium]|nr:hypothetical protein [Magnetococcales bacterium]